MNVTWNGMKWDLIGKTNEKEKGGVPLGKAIAGHWG